MMLMIITIARNLLGHKQIRRSSISSDVNKDWTHKDQDKDKDQNHKDKDQTCKDKDKDWTHKDKDKDLTNKDSKQKKDKHSTLFLKRCH